jgi:hypothetical protein
VHFTRWGTIGAEWFDRSGVAGAAALLVLALGALAFASPALVPLLDAGHPVRRLGSPLTDADQRAGVVRASGRLVADGDADWAVCSLRVLRSAVVRCR